MAFSMEVKDFISAFGAMNQALGTKSSREAERARTDYTRALADKTRWDMGESDRDAAGILGYADDRYGSIELDSGGEGDDSLVGGIGSGPIVIDGVTITGDFNGVDPSMTAVLRGMARGAKQAGLDRLDLTGGYEGGHKSHLSHHDLDFKGYSGNTLWTPEQRVAVARGGAAGGADRFGLYSFGDGYTGNGSLHIGRSGAANPRTGNRTPSAVWGYKGMTGGDASRAFTDPYERAFLRKFNTRDLVGGAGNDVLEAVPTRSGPREYPYRQAAGGTGGDLWKFRDAIASAESEGSGDYNAVNETSGALGRYQVMPANIPSWTKAALGRSVTPEQFLADPQIQDLVFDKIFGENLAKHGARDAISIWFTGRPEAVAGADESDGAMRNKEYIDKVMAALGGGFGSGVNPPTYNPPPQFDEMQAVLEAGGQELLPEFTAETEARTKDDELDLDVIQSKPDSKIPWYNRGDYGSDRYAEMSEMQAIQEAIATSPIMAPPTAPEGVSANMQAGRAVPKWMQVPPGEEGLTYTGNAIMGNPDLGGLMARRTVPDGGLVEGMSAALPKPVSVSRGLGGEDAPIAGAPIAGAPVPGSASPSTTSALFEPMVPDPNMRPEAAEGPGTVPVAETLPTPPVRPSGAIDEEAATMGVDPLPQTSGHFDPVSQAGHETLTNSIRGTGNRHRQPFPQLLGRIFGAGREMLGVPDEAVEVDDDDPRKDAFLGGVGGLNAELIDAVEDRVRAGQPDLSEEQVRMEVLSTLWNYFNEQGQPDKADKVAFAAMQSYKQISQLYLAISQAALEEGDMEAAVDNYRAAYGMIPDGDVVDLVQAADGNFQVTIADANTGEQKKVMIKTPDQIAADIMDTTPEIFDNLIKKKIQGAGAEPTAAEIAAQQEADWFAAGGLPSGAPDEAAIPTPSPRPGMAGGEGEDLLEEAVPTDVASVEEDVTPDVTLEGADSGEEAVPTMMADAGASPSKPMSFDELNTYLTEIPAGARGAAVQMWKLQNASYAAWQKTQPTPEDIAASEATNEFFRGLAETPNFDPKTGAPIQFDPDESIYGVVGKDMANLMRLAVAQRNADMWKLTENHEKATQAEALALGLSQALPQPNVPPSPVPASSPVMGGDRTGTIQNLEPIVPGSVTAEQLRRPINTAEMPRPKTVPEINPALAASMSDSGRGTYTQAIGDEATANTAWNKGFQPQALDVSKIGADSGDVASIGTSLVGSYEERAEVTDMSQTDTPLGHYIRAMTVNPESDSAKSVNIINNAFTQYPNLVEKVGGAAQAIFQTPNGTDMSIPAALETAMSMLAVNPTNPEMITYAASPDPNNPGIVNVSFATSQGGANTVAMPIDVYNDMDAWRAQIQADYINSVEEDRLIAQGNTDRQTAAGAAVQADIAAQAAREAGTIPPAAGGGLIPSGPSLMELDMAIPEDER